jgi:hypothetical protein
MNSKRDRRLPSSLAALAATALLLLLLPSAAAAQALGAGKVSIALDPVVTMNLFGSAIAPYPTTPATMTWAATGAHLVMPVSGGTWSKAGMRGTFVLRGGLDYASVTSGPTVRRLPVTAWRASVNSTGVWTAVAGASRIPAVSENLAGAGVSYPTTAGHKYVRVVNVALFLSNDLTDAINNAFSMLMPYGETFGTATLTARLK